MSDQSGPVNPAHTRRQFIKRAGMAAVWTVPTMQVVNMASAAAGGSPVGTSVTPTTRPPIPCDEIVLLKAVAVYEEVGDDLPSWHWLEELLPNGLEPCIEVGEFFNPGQSITIDGDANSVEVEHEIANCRIVAIACRTDGQELDVCDFGDVADDGFTASCDSEGQIYKVELLVECCLGGN